ncbi:hypothetical protein [Knoellia sinensis]|uniref:hypothetical protein n=1 Tax=Knoellia sinensis TaxID=136100 RepID=UPI001FE130CE|nr:hypothetical protein [Knoellia sinensis]
MGDAETEVDAEGEFAAVGDSEALADSELASLGVAAEGPGLDGDEEPEPADEASSAEFEPTIRVSAKVPMIVRATKAATIAMT